MKKIITVTLCIVLVLLFAGCGKNGDTSKVEIDYGASSIYSKEEIDSAIEIIKKQFALFEGCELHRLSYMTDEECNNADNIEWMNDLRTDDNKEAFTQWASVQQAEVDVSLVKEDYIIDGKIDLVKGVDGTVEIVDFKSERKPDMVKMRERLEHYRRQLQIYAYLIEQRTGQKVSKMHLYYTGEENGNPMITYPYTRTAIEGTVAAFDDTVHKILRKDFKHRCDDAKTCKNCDFRYYCNK